MLKNHFGKWLPTWINVGLVVIPLSIGIYFGIVKEIQAVRVTQIEESKTTALFRAEIFSVIGNLREESWETRCKQDAVIMTLKESKDHNYNILKNLDKALSDHRRETQKEQQRQRQEKGSSLEMGVNHPVVQSADNEKEDGVVIRPYPIKEGPEWARQVRP